MIEAHDTGDEHVERPPVVVELDPLTKLLLEDPTACTTVSAEVMEFIMLAEAYRHCCHACALEVNGEDGS